MAIKTTAYDAADFLNSPEEIEAYLEAAFETNDKAVVAVAVGNVARARGMGKVAAAAGLSRESLYKALGENGNPELGTVLKVLKELGVTLIPKVEAH